MCIVEHLDPLPVSRTGGDVGQRTVTTIHAVGRLGEGPRRLKVRTHVGCHSAEHHLRQRAIGSSRGSRDGLTRYRLRSTDSGDEVADGGDQYRYPKGERHDGVGTPLVAEDGQTDEVDHRERHGEHGSDHEIDFILEGDEGIVALEVKLSSSLEDRDVRHLHWLRERLGGDLIDAAVITTGSEAYRRSDGIAVIPLALLGA